MWHFQLNKYIIDYRKHAHEEAVDAIALKLKKINTKTLEALTIAGSSLKFLNDCVEVESQGFNILIGLPTDSQSVGVIQTNYF